MTCLLEKTDGEIDKVFKGLLGLMMMMVRLLSLQTRSHKGNPSRST